MLETGSLFGAMNAPVMEAQNGITETHDYLSMVFPTIKETGLLEVQTYFVVRACGET